MLKLHGKRFYTMKLALASDIHLEFGPISLKNEEMADVLILSGDICLANKFEDIEKDFFENCSKEFANVIYIMGNHEHYGNDFQKSKFALSEKLSYLENISILEKENKAIQDITFVCGTLWTDMNKNDPNTLWHVSRVMNDFRTIQNGIDLLKPEDVYNDHLEMMNHIRKSIQDSSKKYVVVGHHAPSKMSVKPKYKKDALTNGAYSSDLSEFILDHPQIKLWTHGHTHDSFDYMVGETRVVCNPRGYIGYESIANRFKLKYYTI